MAGMVQNDYFHSLELTWIKITFRTVVIFTIILIFYTALNGTTFPGEPGLQSQEVKEPRYPIGLKWLHTHTQLLVRYSITIPKIYSSF